MLVKVFCTQVIYSLQLLLSLVYLAVYVEKQFMVFSEDKDFEKHSKCADFFPQNFDHQDT